MKSSNRTSRMGKASHSKEEELSLNKESSKCKEPEKGEFGVFKEVKGATRSSDKEMQFQHYLFTVILFKSC